MRLLIFLFSLLSLGSCQSQFPTSEQLLMEEQPVKLARTTSYMSGKGAVKTWYSELHELDGFAGYEEENGIMLGKKYSVATYSKEVQSKVKMVVLEKIRHQDNGEAQFKKLDVLKIKLQDNQFLTTDFCSSESDESAKILAVYEISNEDAATKKVMTAWKIDTKTLTFKSIAVEGVACVSEF